MLHNKGVGPKTSEIIYFTERATVPNHVIIILLRISQ